MPAAGGPPDALPDHRQLRGRRRPLSACFPENASSLLFEHRVPDGRWPLARRVPPFFSHAAEEALPIKPEWAKADDERAQHLPHGFFALLCRGKPGLERFYLARGLWPDCG